MSPTATPKAARTGRVLADRWARMADVDTCLAHLAPTIEGKHHA